jgi:hypothetical protein
MENGALRVGVGVGAEEKADPAVLGADEEYAP